MSAAMPATLSTSMPATMCNSMSATMLVTALLPQRFFFFIGRHAGHHVSHLVGHFVQLHVGHHVGHRNVVLRSQRRWQNGNPKPLRADGHYDCNVLKFVSNVKNITNVPSNFWPRFFVVEKQWVYYWLLNIKWLSLEIVASCSKCCDSLSGDHVSQKLQQALTFHQVQLGTGILVFRPANQIQCQAWISKAVNVP